MRNIIRLLLLVSLLAFFFSTAAPVAARTYVVPVWYGFTPYVTPYYYAVHAVRNHPYYYRGYPYAVGWGYNWNRFYPSFVSPTQWSWAWHSAATTPSYWGGAQGHFGWVTTNRLNLRSSPGLGGKSRNSNVIGSLNYGERVSVTGQSGNWYYVQSIDQPGKQGYVSTSYVAGGAGYGWPGWYGGWPYAASGWAPVPYARVAW